MGCSPGDNEFLDREKPAHQVEITKGFWMGETPVTQEAWERVTGSRPSVLRDPLLPVVKVNWEEAGRYCRAIGMRLPTEAEWEYAARANNPTARYGELDDIAWNRGNSGDQAHAVKGKLPNAWGLYDTLGNVEEWVADWYDESCYQWSEARDPTGPKKGTDKVVRRGSWGDNAPHIRVSDRDSYEPTRRTNYIGFRCTADIL